MAPSASVSELQALADQKLTELSAQIDQRQQDVQALEVRKKNLEDAVNQLEHQQGVAQEHLKTAGDQLDATTKALTEAQQKNLTRLEKAESDADAAQKAAEKAIADLGKTKNDLHALREKVRAVLFDASNEANEAHQARTKAHEAYTKSLDALLELVTVKDAQPEE